MSGPSPLMPRQAVPSLDVPLVGGGRYVLSEEGSQNFSVIVFYRGYHCPVCNGYLNDLLKHKPAFEERGASVVAVSSDTQERAEKSVQDWGLDGLRVAYGLDLGKAQEWGLYISTSRGKTSIGVEEPAMFNEPGLFLVRPDNTLYFGSVQTMPFARPAFEGILGGLDFVLKTDYPARGQVVDPSEIAA